MKKSRTPRHRRGIIRSLLNLLTPQGRQAVLSNIIYIYISIPVIGISTLSNPANLWAQIPELALDKDVTVGEDEIVTVTDFHINSNDPSKTITLDGGFLYLYDNFAYSNQQNPETYKEGTVLEISYLGKTYETTSEKYRDTPITYSWHLQGYNFPLDSGYESVLEKSIHQFAWGANGGIIHVEACNPPHSTIVGDKYFSANLVLINSAARCNNQAIGTFTKSGAGTLVIEADLKKNQVDTGTLDYGSENLFSSVWVADGTLMVNGPSTFEYIQISPNKTSKSPPQLMLTGKQIINTGILVKDGGTLCINSTGSKSQINGSIYVQNSTALLLGSIAYNDENSPIICEQLEEGESIIGGNASALNTDIYVVPKQRDSAMLYLGDFTREAQLSDKNIWYITKDKNGNRTPLEWEAARNNINNAIKTNQIHDKKLSGNGNLLINSYHPTTEEGSASYNGYTVVFQDIKNNGNFTQWNGYTCIMAGTLVLRQGVVYGNEKTFGLEVCGEEYTSIGTNESGIEVYNVDSCGMLAFYTNGAETAPTVNGYTFALSDGEDGGARLWFDTNTKAENGNMGTINVNEAIIGSKTQVWYDGISKIDSDTTRSITLNAMQYSKGELNEEGKYIYIDNAKEAKEYIENIFGQAALVDATYNLANGSISITPRDVADFAAEQNMTRDEQDYAAVIDENRLEAEDGYSNFYDALYNENSDSKVRQTIHNLANGSGIENVMMLTSHMGNPGSVFFGGMTTMGGASTRGQEEQPESSNPVSAAPQSYQQQDPNRWTAWANYSHSAINGSAYVKDGIRKDGYDVRRTGILTGLKNNLSDTFSMGVLFAYSSPELNQNGFYESDSGNDRYFTNIEMNDFQLALQFNKLLPRNWHLSAFVGGGAQSLDWKRNVIVDNTGYQFTGDTDGNTLTATFYLSKHLQMTETFALMPTIGFDTEHSWMDGFSEKGNDMNDPAHILSATASKYNYDNIAYDRQTFRVGLFASTQSPTNIFGASARVFYGRQLNDEEAATVHIWNDTFKKGFDVEGNAMGKDSWNFGFNGYMYLNTAKTLTLTADYNTILYRNASMQNVTAGLQWRF